MIEILEKQRVTIEKLGNLKQVSTFNNLTKIQRDVLNLLKYDSRSGFDYGYLYLKLMEKYGYIKILNLPDKCLSPETPNRISRKLKEYANNNPELRFLLRYNHDYNDKLNEESVEFYRNN